LQAQQGTRSRLISAQKNIYYGGCLQPRLSALGTCPKLAPKLARNWYGGMG